MTSLSQRLLHTSLAHRVGSRAISGNASTPAPRITSQQAAEGARHLLPVDEQDPNPIRPFEKNQVSLNYRVSDTGVGDAGFGPLCSGLLIVSCHDKSFAPVSEVDAATSWPVSFVRSADIQ